MQQNNIFLAALLAGAVSVSAAAGAQGATPATQGATPAHAARAAKVTLRHTRLGNILATSSGFTLYEFTHDHSSANTCVHISECSGTWPALQTSGRPTAGPGVKASLLSTTRLPGGKTQVTYAGHPLYLYSGDSGPGATSYVGESAFGGRWYALNALGGAVK
jgi:predicted lipoprotein with Yx(FWY)xxD motif